MSWVLANKLCWNGLMAVISPVVSLEKQAMSHLPQDLHAVLDHEVMHSHSKGAPWLCTKTTSLLLKLNRNWCTFPSRWSARRSTSVCKQTQGDRESWLDSKGTHTGNKQMAECCRLNPDFVLVGRRPEEEFTWTKPSSLWLYSTGHFTSVFASSGFLIVTTLSYRAASESNQLYLCLNLEDSVLP